MHGCNRLDVGQNLLFGAKLALQVMGTLFGADAQPLPGCGGLPKGLRWSRELPKSLPPQPDPPWGDKTRSGTSEGDETLPKSMVLGEAGLMAWFLVQILREHVMVRVGGGWDTLQHYLDKHDPCRCTSLCECPCPWEGRKGGLIAASGGFQEQEAPQPQCFAGKSLLWGMALAGWPLEVTADFGKERDLGEAQIPSARCWGLRGASLADSTGVGWGGGFLETPPQGWGLQR